MQKASTEIRPIPTFRPERSIPPDSDKSDISSNLGILSKSVNPLTAPLDRIPMRRILRSTLGSRDDPPPSSSCERILRILSGGIWSVGNDHCAWWKRSLILQKRVENQVPR